MGGGAEVIDHGHGSAVGVEEQLAGGLGEVGQADGLVVVGAGDAAAVLVAQVGGGAGREGDGHGGPAVGAGNGRELDGFEGGITPFQRQGGAVEEERRGPGMRTADAHAGIGVDLECHRDRLRNAAGGGEEAMVGGARESVEVLDAAGADGHEVGGDGRGQAEQDAVGALRGGRDGGGAADGPLGQVHHGRGGDGFVEDDVDGGTADGAGRGTDVGRVALAAEIVRHAVGVHIDGDFHVIQGRDDAVGVVRSGGLVGDGVGGTPGAGGVVVVDAGQQAQGGAAGDGFAGLDGAEAGAFIEVGPRNADFEPLVRAGGGVVQAGHVDRRADRRGAVAAVEQGIQVVGGRRRDAVVADADDVVVGAFAGEHVIEAEGAAGRPAVVVVLDEAGLHAGPVGGGGGAGAGAGIGIQQDHELVVAGLPGLQADVQIGGIPGHVQVGQRAVGAPGGGALKSVSEVVVVVFDGPAIQHRRVEGRGKGGGCEQEQGADTGNSFHDRLHIRL